MLLAADLRGRRALVVDDNQSARTVLGQLLQSMGFLVEEADSGQAAIEAVVRGDGGQSPYDVVFLDWRMPHLNGIETAEMLRSRALARPPHMVMVTAYGRDEILSGAEQAGFEDVLIKPVSASLLFDTVASVLGGTPSERRRIGDASSRVMEDPGAVGGARILLVEDNELNQEVALELLRDAGFVVEFAANGEIALRMLGEGSYDLVLMDMQMPVMDGVTATIEIRKIAGLEALPIVAMTANAMEGDRQRCLEAGMNDHVAKPVEPDALWKVLRKWLKPRVRAGATVPLARPTTAPVEIPVDIAGLDTAVGLAHMAGKRPLYVSMLRKFVAGQACAVAEVRAAIECGDLATAERVAHTTKGVAGSIGALLVPPLAAEVERSIRAREPREATSAALDELSGPLDALVAALALALPPEPEVAPIAVDGGRVLAVCARLEALLADADSEATEVLAENSVLLESAFPNHYRAVAAAIRSFDFDTARIALREAAAALGEPTAP